MSQTQQTNLLCPKCTKQSAYSVSTSESANQLKCEHCKATFTAWIVKIRAKHSRQDKRANTRRYSVRVVSLAGREDLIEFTQTGINDFELRSGDLAVFSYLNKKLLLIENLTIGRYLSLKSGCSTVTIVICLLLAGALVFLCALSALFTRLSSSTTSSPSPRSTPIQRSRRPS
jgi:hypothetical protein